MAKTRLKFATLDEDSLTRLHTLENQMGSVVLAVEPVYPVADLTEEQIRRVQALEKELDVILLAYPV